jgi:hypothetical protein
VTNERSTIVRKVVGWLKNDDGMSTVEYAVGTLAAATFGAVLMKVVSSDSIRSALSAIIARALH